MEILQLLPLHLDLGCLKYVLQVSQWPEGCVWILLWQQQQQGCMHEESCSTWVKSATSGIFMPRYIQVQKKRFANRSTVPVSSEEYSPDFVWYSPLLGLSFPGGTHLAVWESLSRWIPSPTAVPSKCSSTFMRIALDCACSKWNKLF